MIYEHNGGTFIFSMYLHQKYIIIVISKKNDESTLRETEKQIKYFSANLQTI